MAEPYYEILLSGPAGREQTIRAALMNAGVGKDDFVPCHHGWEHLEHERTKGWVAYRADDLQAADIACKKAKGWQVRIHRHAIGLAIQEQVPGPRIDPLEHVRSRLDGLERMVAGLLADNARLRGEPPPIAGGALESPPWVIKADQHSADLFRQMPQSMLSATGVVNSGDLLVSPGGSQPPPAVSVAAGQVWIPGTIEGTTGFGTNSGAQTSVGNTNGGTSTSTAFPTSFTSQGSYYAYQDGTVSLSITSADPSNPRIDLVCATVQDAEYAGSANQCVLQVITGTAGASPAPTAPPANSVVASSVWVPAAATSITSGDLNDLRPFTVPQRAGAMLQPIRYHRSASGSPSFIAAQSVVSMDTLDYDASGGAYTLSGGKLTVPAAGYYAVTVEASGASSGTTYDLFLNVGHNSSQYGGGSVSVNTGQATSATTTEIVKCAVGDSVSCLVALAGVSSIALNVSGTPAGNSITVMRVA